MSPQDVLQSGFDFKKSKIQPTHPLRPVQTDNTRPFRFTAAAGTEFAGAVHPLRSIKDRCLGKLLPHQLANSTLAHPLEVLNFYLCYYSKLLLVYFH